MKLRPWMVCWLFVILVSMNVYGRPFYEDYPYLYETFTYDLGECTESNGAITLAENGVDGKGNCAFVEATKLNSLICPVQFEIGKTYQFSAWIKYKDRVPSQNRLRMCMFFGTPESPEPTVEGGVPNDKCKLYKDALTTDVWYYYTWLYTHTGFAPDGITTISNSALLVLRPGEKGDASVQNPLTYYVDDLRMEEVKTPENSLTVSGNEVVGETLRIGTSLTANRYMFRILRNTEQGQVLVHNRLTTSPGITYRLTKEDANQTLTLECFSLGTDGTMIAKEEYTTQTVYRPIGHLFYLRDFSDTFRIGFKGTVKDFMEFPILASYQEEALLNATIGEELLGDELERGARSKLFFWDKELIPQEDTRTLYDGETFLYVNPKKAGAENTFATVQEAKEYVRTLLNQGGGTIYVVLSPEEHILTEPLVFTQEDCGKRKVIYTSFGEEKAKLSGGLHLEGEWNLKDAEKNIYEVSVPKGTKTRQLFVNGIRGQRARSKESLSNCTTTDIGHTTTDVFLKDYAKVKDLEMVYSSKWINMRCGVQRIDVADGIATITMDEGWSLRPTGQTAPKNPEYYENAYELLDEEGEWYLDEETAKLYYKPRAYEDIRNADVVIPIIERLIEMQGTYENHIRNIAFENLDFCYTTWMRPSSEEGYFVNQNNTLTVDGYEGMGSSYSQHVDGALELNSVTDVDFKDCRFTKLGTTALKLIGGVSHCDIVGNEFVDNSAGAIVLGQCGYAVNFGEVVRPDKTYPDTAENYYVQYNNVIDNYIHKCSVDYKSASAISVGFARYSNISHNEIFDVPYTGIHIGWGWSGCTRSVLRALCVENNYIHNILNQEIYDGGAIYTLGGTDIGRNQKDEDGNVIVYDDRIFEDEGINILRGNYMVDIKNRNGPMYNDAGSSGYLWENNVVDISSTPYWYGNQDGTFVSSWYNGGGTVEGSAIKAVNTYSTTDRLVGEDAVGLPTEGFYVYEDADWPAEAQMIIENSGISQTYLDKFGTALQEISLKDYYYLEMGETEKLNLKVKTRKGKYCTPDGAKVYWFSNAPEIISVDSSGTVNALQTGKAEITAYVLKKEQLLDVVKTTVYSQQDFEVAFNTDAIGVVKGDSFTLQYSLYDIFDMQTPLTETEDFTVAMEMADTSVAIVNASGKISGISEGITTLKVSVSRNGFTYIKDLPVRVYGAYAESPTAADIFEDYDNWSLLAAHTEESSALQHITPMDHGVAICTTDGAAVYQQKLGDFFWKFNMKMDENMYISFRQNRKDKAYRYSQCYFLWMEGGGRIQLDRSYATSTRTRLAGGSNVVFPAEKLGQEVEMLLGCINVDEGVRMIVAVDGEIKIDTIDCRKDALKNIGYLMIYTNQGSNYFINTLEK